MKRYDPLIWFGLFLAVGLLGVAGITQFAGTYLALLLICVVGALLYIPVVAVILATRALKRRKKELSYRSQYGVASTRPRSWWWGL